MSRRSARRAPAPEEREEDRAPGPAKKGLTAGSVLALLLTAAVTAAVVWFLVRFGG